MEGQIRAMQTATVAQASCLPAEAPLQLETLEELATLVSGRWQGVLHDSRQALAGSLAMGALVIMFSERPETQAEVNNANRARRGRKFTAYGFVARQLARQYGEALPTEKHLRNCARAAEAARRKGLTEGSICNLLGWAADKTTKLVPEIKPPALPIPKDEDGQEERDTPPAKLLLRRFAVIKGAVQKAVADIQKETSRFRWSRHPQEEAKWQTQLDSINEYLQYFDLELVDVKKKGKRK